MRKMLLAGTVGGGLLVSALVAGHLTTKGAGDSATAITAAVPATETAVPAKAAAAAPDVAGARAKAIAVVASTGSVVQAGLISRRTLIESFSTPAFGDRLASDTSAQVDQMLAELGADGIDASRLVVLEQPVTASVTAEESARARVSVWSVLVVSAPGTGVARAAWRTVTLDLALVEGTWLVDGWVSSPGPTPALPPEAVVSSSDDVSVRLAGVPSVAGLG